MRILMAAAAALSVSTFALAEEAQAPIETVTIFPPFSDVYACSEHWEGQLKYKGDSLGTDCYVTGLVETPSVGAFASAFRSDGLTNEDWFSYGAEVHAPFDAEIVKIMRNDTVNQPGELGKPPATFVIFKNTDGRHVLIAHVTDIIVAEGDQVVAGQVFAVVGNNGYGRSPHVHIGAWDDKGPLQIRHDLRARGVIMSDSKASEE